MTTRAITFHQQTRLAISVVIEDESGTLAFTLFLVTTLFRLVGYMGRVVARATSETSLFISDLQTALQFTWKVLVIGFNALAYGLGVSL